MSDIELRNYIRQVVYDATDLSEERFMRKYGKIWSLVIVDYVNANYTPKYTEESEHLEREHKIGEADVVQP